MLAETEAKFLKLLLRGVALKIYKAKYSIVVIEGFVISIVFHLIGGYFIAQKIGEVFHNIPNLSIAIFSSSIFSTLVAIIYMWFRLKLIPKVVLNRYVFIYSIPLAIVVCLVIFASVVYTGNEYIILAKRIASINHPYFLPTLSMLIFWGPCFEEILYRGYFFERLRSDHGNLIALFISSFLFVFFHGIFGGFTYRLFFVFFYSVVFSFSYMGGGIFSSIITHSLVNFYLFYMNTDF